MSAFQCMPPTPGTGVIAGRCACTAFIEDALQTLRLSPSTVSNRGVEDNDVNDESSSGCESDRGDEANEYNDESDSGDEANNDDLQWGTHSVDASCENLLDRVYNAVRNGQSPYELQKDGWQIGTIREAVGIWHDLGAFVKSPEKGLSPSPGLRGGELAAADFLTILYPLDHAAGPGAFFSHYAGAFRSHFDIVRGLSNGVWWPDSSRQYDFPVSSGIRPNAPGFDPGSTAWLNPQTGLPHALRRDMASGRAYPSTLVSVSPVERQPVGERTCFASTFAAAQTAIAMGADTSCLVGTVRRRLCMLFAVNMAFGGLAAAGNFTTVYPLDYARTHLAWDVGSKVCSIAGKRRVQAPRASDPSVEERPRLCIHVCGGTDSHHNWRGYPLSLRQCPQASPEAKREADGAGNVQRDPSPATFETRSATCRSHASVLWHPMSKALHAEVSPAHTDPR